VYFQAIFKISGNSDVFFVLMENTLNEIDIFHGDDLLIWMGM